MPYGRIGAALLAVVVGAACADTEAPLAPETPVVAAEARNGINKKDPGQTIVDIAVAAASDPAAPQFTTLVAAVVAADLVDVLNGRRQFTVFAPTDAAFADLGITAANLDDLLATGALTKGLLTDILLYHVAPGNRKSGDVVGSEQIRTMNGGFLGVRVGSPMAGLGVYLEDQDPDNGDSEILAVDIFASNGVIHVINQVLLPIDLQEKIGLALPWRCPMRYAERPGLLPGAFVFLEDWRSAPDRAWSLDKGLRILTSHVDVR